MYLMHVVPWKSSKWVPPEGEELITADKLALTPGAGGIRKERPFGPGRTTSTMFETAGGESSTARQEL